jgi:activator of HSP90 ATPase
MASNKGIKDLGFQVSVSKTFHVSTQILWEFILSESGIRVWLGEFEIDDFEIQKQFVTREGIEGKLTVFVPDCHLRLKWKPSSYARQTTLELRITNVQGKARIIFHQTGFYQIEQKEELRNYWKQVISKVSTAIEAFPERN